ncbi:MAG: leucine-rich repeat protein [Clostridia bacterium]|nr:leucine-rich repeat protein [Clostridia bacterium]
MRDTKNEGGLGYNQKGDIEQIVDYLIAEHRDEFELELSQKLKGFEAQLRSDFNRRLELIRKDLSENLKGQIELINRNNNVVNTSPSIAPPIVECDYLKYNETAEGLCITGLNEKYSSKTDVYIPATINGKRVAKIGDNAFLNNQIIEKVEIANGIETIGKKAFSACANLKELIIPDSVTSIQREAMYASKKLERVNIPKNIKVLEYGVLYQAGIKSLELPEGLKEIGALALCGCYALRQINIPSTVTTIGNYGFYYCFFNQGADGEIYIPDSVAKIDADVFGGCRYLKISCGAKRKPAGWNEKWNSGNCPVKWGAKY